MLVKFSPKNICFYFLIKSPPLDIQQKNCNNSNMIGGDKKKFKKSPALRKKKDKKEK